MHARQPCISPLAGARIMTSANSPNRRPTTFHKRFCGRIESGRGAPTVTSAGAEPRGIRQIAVSARLWRTEPLDFEHTRKNYKYKFPKEIAT